MVLSFALLILSWIILKLSKLLLIPMEPEINLGLDFVGMLRHFIIRILGSTKVKMLKLPMIMIR